MSQLTGCLFERYLNDLLLRTCAGPNLFVPAPMRAIGDRIELTDGMIVCGSTLILIEYKSAMFTAEAKYSGDRHLLRKEIEKKLLRNERGKPKGVSQLKNAIDYLNEVNLVSAVQGIDLSGVKTIYPLIITLEPLGDGVLISRILDREFGRLRTPLKPEKFNVKRLHCTGTATIERLAGAFSTSAISQLLSEWDDADPKFQGCWKMYFDPSRHQTTKLFNRVRFEQMGEQVMPLLQLHD